jgi:hypothetical protein
MTSMASVSSSASGGPPPLPTSPIKNRRWRFSVVTALMVVGAVLLYIHDPRQPGKYFPPCVFHKCTGLHCPGCGTTRACHLVLHGEFSAALSYNALTVLVIPFLACAYFQFARTAMGFEPVERRCSRSANVWKGRIFLFVGICFLVYGVLRNLPMYPFTLLAPGGLTAR